MNKMKRRSALKTIGLGMGYTMTAASMATFMTSCKQDQNTTGDAATWAPSFMNKSQTRLVEKILDALLPTTEFSPGFQAVNAIQIFDNTLAKLWKKEDQEDFKAGLAQLANWFKVNHKVKIDQASDEHITEFMSAHMGKLKNKDKEKRDGLIWAEKENLKPEQMDDHLFYKLIYNLRDLGIGTYFSNETIATEYLAYDPVPGGYNGCMPMSEGQVSWSL